MVIHRTHFWVHGLRPQQDVTVFKSVHTTQTFAPAVCIDSLGATIFASSHRCGVIPMDRAHVVTVAAVFHLKFPIAVVGVSRATTQNFQSFSGLVNDLVDHHFRFT